MYSLLRDEASNADRSQMFEITCNPHDHDAVSRTFVKYLYAYIETEQNRVAAGADDPFEVGWVVQALGRYRARY